MAGVVFNPSAAMSSLQRVVASFSKKERLYLTEDFAVSATPSHAAKIDTLFSKVRVWMADNAKNAEPGNKLLSALGVVQSQESRAKLLTAAFSAAPRPQKAQVAAVAAKFGNDEIVTLQEELSLLLLVRDFVVIQKRYVETFLALNRQADLLYDLENFDNFEFFLMLAPFDPHGEFIIFDDNTEKFHLFFERMPQALIDKLRSTHFPEDSAQARLVQIILEIKQLNTSESRAIESEWRHAMHHTLCIIKKKRAHIALLQQQCPGFVKIWSYLQNCSKDHNILDLTVFEELDALHQQMSMQEVYAPYQERLDKFNTIKNTQFAKRVYFFDKTYNKRITEYTIARQDERAPFLSVEEMQKTVIPREEKAPAVAQPKAAAKKRKRRSPTQKIVVPTPAERSAAPPSLPGAGASIPSAAANGAGATPEEHPVTPPTPGAGAGALSVVAKDEKKKPAAPVARNTAIIKEILKNRTFPFREITYDDRVNRWEEDREFAPGVTPDTATWKHAFSSLVDLFIGTAYSFVDTWDNKKRGHEDLCFCIVADCIFANGEIEPGVFQFTFDKNGVLYHRYFGKESNIARLKRVMDQLRHEVDYPPLVVPKEAVFSFLDEHRFEINEQSGSIQFHDATNNMTIKIYKAKKG